MPTPCEPIWRTSLRALTQTIFVMIGLAIGAVPFLLIIGLVTGDSDDIKKVYSAEILPNAKGVRKAMGDNVPIILQLRIDGFIGSDKLNLHTVRQQLVESREGKFKNNRVKGLILHVDSGGGTVVDADGIYQAIKEYKEQFGVPVYAFVDGMCASGAFYAACAADEIFATPSSLVGSVGVRLGSPFFNLTKVLSALDIPVKTFAEGIDKDSLNPFRPWKEDEGKGLESIMNYYYSDFVDKVVANRPELSREALIKTYGARIFPAEEAQKFGYVDNAEQTWRGTLSALLEKLEIEDDKYQVIQLDKEKWIHQLFQSGSAIAKGVVEHKLVLGNEPTSDLKSPFLYHYNPNG